MLSCTRSCSNFPDLLVLFPPLKCFHDSSQLFLFSRVKDVQEMIIRYGKQNDDTTHPGGWRIWANPSCRALHKTRPKVVFAHSVQSMRYSNYAKQMLELRSMLTRWLWCEISLTRGYKVSRFCPSTQTWKDKIVFLFSPNFLSYPVGQNRVFPSGVIETKDNTGWMECSEYTEHQGHPEFTLLHSKLRFWFTIQQLPQTRWH